MSCNDTITVISSRFTEGDLEDPLVVKWGEELTTETSEIIIERPDGTSVTIAGSLIDASVGAFEYQWSSGDLQAGERQLVKARLFRAGGRRKSTEYFRINVDEDIA